jgi:uncharacterized protein
MQALWLPLRDIPAQGREFSFSDPGIWTEPMAEFKLGYRATIPLESSVRVQLHGDGCLMSGSISGVVSTVCDRCLEEVQVRIEVSFDEYEELPPQPQIGKARSKERKPDKAEEEAQALGEAERLLRWNAGHPELNVGALLWEQFVLALPVKPLCRLDCRGLCPSCGKNLNTDACSCARDEGDPRLATLRGLKIERQ